MGNTSIHEPSYDCYDFRFRVPGFSQHPGARQQSPAPVAGGSAEERGPDFEANARVLPFYQTSLGSWAFSKGVFQNAWFTGENPMKNSEDH